MDVLFIGCKVKEAWENSHLEEKRWIRYTCIYISLSRSSKCEGCLIVAVVVVVAVEE